MNEADIDRIIERQGYTSHIDVRTTVRGDGTTHSYVCLRKQGLRRSIHLAAMTKLGYPANRVESHEDRPGQRQIPHDLPDSPKLLKMSEADLVALIKTKTLKSAQTAQKGKE